MNGGKKKLLNAALKYAEMGTPVFPVKPRGKVPLTKHGFKDATIDEKQIKEWWKKWPTANIAIPTGAASGLVVIDIDEKEGFDEVNKLIPDSLETPTANTPGGGQHLYFKDPGNTSNKARNIPGCDYRGDNGYIIMPPSKGENGKAYEWLISIFSTQPAELPAAYLKHALSSINTNTVYRGVNGCVTLSFQQGNRDESLFSVANFLVKGGMDEWNIAHVLGILAKNCNPPFPEKDVEVKIRSALQRTFDRDRNLTQEIREWVMSTKGVFSSTDVHRELNLSTKVHKKNSSTVLARLIEEGLIVREGKQYGRFRRLDDDCEVVDWRNAPTETFPIKWPLGIEGLVETYPGNTVVVAGEPNAGKTAFVLNLIRLNMDRHEIHYFSSEMAGTELRKRLSAFNLPLDAWKFRPWERSDDFADVVRPNALNVIDYMEIHDEFYKVGGWIKQVADRLKDGIAVIALQKNRGTDYGLGGMRGLERPRLYLAMSPGVVRIIKAKNWRGTDNPNGKELHFKLAQGARFITVDDWHRPKK